MFVGGLTAARFGLHLFDLCIIQLFQEGVSECLSFSKFTEYKVGYVAQTNTCVQVEEEKRGVFSGVETSICYGMDLLKFVLVRTKISSHSRTL